MSKHQILISRADLFSCPNTRIITTQTDPVGNETGSFRLINVKLGPTASPVIYAYTRQKKSRYVSHEVDTIPTGLLDRLIENDINYKIEVTAPQAPLVDVCRANSDLATSNIDLRTEIETLKGDVLYWQKKYGGAATVRDEADAKYTELRNKILSLALELKNQ